MVVFPLKKRGPLSPLPSQGADTKKASNPGAAGKIQLRVSAPFLDHVLVSEASKKTSSGCFEWEELVPEHVETAANNHMRLRQSWLKISAMAGNSPVGTGVVSLRKACTVDAQSNIAYEFTTQLTSGGLPAGSLEGVLLLRWPNKSPVVQPK